MKNHLVVVTLVTFGAVLGCTQSSPTPANTEADRQAIDQLRQQEIARFTAGNIENVLAVFTDDRLSGTRALGRAGKRREVVRSDGGLASARVRCAGQGHAGGAQHPTGRAGTIAGGAAGVPA